MPSYSFEVTGSSIIKLLEIIKKYSSKSKYFQPLSSNMFGNSKNSKQNEAWAIRRKCYQNPRKVLSESLGHPMRMLGVARRFSPRVPRESSIFDLRAGPLKILNKKIEVRAA